MKKTGLYLPSSDAVHQIHVILWEPDSAPKAVLQIVHGMVEHIDRYDHFARFLVDAGYAVLGHDHLGHGKSVRNESEFGHFTDKNGAACLVADILRVTREGKQLFPDCPHLIMGHSMGSFFTRRYLADYSQCVDGAIIMGTGYVSAFVARFGKAVASLIALCRGRNYHSALMTKLFMHGNESPFSSEGKYGWLSRDKANQAVYEADPLCRFSFTVGAYADFFDCMIDLAHKKHFERIRKDLPVLFVTGADDPVGGGKAATAVERDFRKLGLTDLEKHVYLGLRHEILNEAERDTVYMDILRWMDRVVKK